MRTRAPGGLLRRRSSAVVLFDREVTRNESPRLAMLRTVTLVVGATVGADGRETVLRLGMRGARRERFAPVHQQLASLPTGRSLAGQAIASRKSPRSRVANPPAAGGSRFSFRQSTKVSRSQAAFGR